MNFNGKNLAQFIDHTLLKPEATDSQIRSLCDEALKAQFFSVCVNSRFVPLAKSCLKESSVHVVSVVGFPLGAMASEAKAFETEWAIQKGADEIDMVISLGALKQKDENLVVKDIEAVVKAAAGKPVKVILETCLLSEEEKILACQWSVKAGAHFVKTSTGFSTGGATLADVALMKKTVGSKAQVKASGGIKTTELALEMIQLGTTRLGTSSGLALIQGLSPSEGY